MDFIIKKWKALTATVGGQILLALLYAAMVVLILAFFTGHGEFIYEGF
jgi:uncharacterized membrane protein